MLGWDSSGSEETGNKMCQGGGLLAYHAVGVETIPSRGTPWLLKPGTQCHVVETTILFVWRYLAALSMSRM